MVDMTRRSPSYEMRLAKYATRGFSVLVPTFDRRRVDPQLFERRFDQLQGLARLLLLEKLETPEARYRYKEQQRLRKLRPVSEQRQVRFFSTKSLEMYMKNVNQMDFECVSYTSLFTMTPN